MDLKTFRRIQQCQLDILKEVDRVCDYSNLTYYMVGGTLLGAVRHKGFIPWDVDIDIAMPRKDYELFEKVAEEILDSKYELINYKNTHAFSHPHALVCKKGTQLYSKYDKYNTHIHNYGIFIDLFPLDNVPDDERQRKLHRKRINFWRNMQANHVSFSYSGNPFKKCAHKIIRLLYSPFNLDWINKRFDLSLKAFQNRKTSECGAVGTGRFTYEKESMPTCVFGDPVKLEFEGLLFNAPSNYTFWLKRMYGDYMEYPSKAQQEEGYNLFDKVVF